MLTRRIIWALAGNACFLTGAAVAQTVIPPVVLPAVLTRAYVFPPAGLASTETAQVNVVNTAPVPVITTTTTPAPSCSGTISFLNGSGAAIGTPVKFSVSAGQIFSAKLPYGSAGVTGGVRTELRGEVQLTPTVSATPVAFAPCSLAYSFETFDTTTGVTHVFITQTSATTPYSLVLTPGTDR
jgi:hypothetical protein